MATVSITDLTNAKLDTDHIADIATSLALTAMDRLGTTKKTLQGAINSIAAIDVKGAWATTTAYVVKDAVLESGTWYICIEAHTSGTFATDLAAGKWSVLQGITDANLKDYAARKLDFVSDMKAMSNPQAGEIIMLKDYASGNGAGVMFFETKATTGTDDGGSVINHNTLAFRFEQIFGDNVRVEQFGAVGDGITDDTISIVNAGKYLKDGMTLSFSKEVFLISFTNAEEWDAVFGRAAINLNGLSGISIVGNKTTIKINDHDCSAGGLLFIHAKAVHDFSVSGFNFDMTFVNANNTSTLYPYCGGVVVSDGTATGVKTQAELSKNISVTDCVFKLFHPWGSYVTTTNPHMGDPNNGFKIFSVLCFGDNLATNFSNQNSSVNFERCVFEDGHNGYGLWVWAYNDVNFVDNTAKSWVTKRSDTTGNLLGGGVPFIRYHQFYCTGTVVSGNYFRAKPCNLRLTAGFEGEGSFAHLNTNLDDDVGLGVTNVVNNTLVMGNGDSANSIVDFGISCFCYGAINIQNNTIDGITTTTNALAGGTTIYYSQQYVTGGDVQLNIVGNTGGKNLSYYNSIRIRSGSPTDPLLRRIKTLNISDNVYGSHSQYYIDIATMAVAYMGCEQTNISNNVFRGTDDTVFGKSSTNSVGIRLANSLSTDTLTISDNSFTDINTVFDVTSVLASSSLGIGLNKSVGHMTYWLGTKPNTFTPTFSPETGSFTTITPVTTGVYSLVGDMCFCHITVRTTGSLSIGSASGELKFGGLPFVPAHDGSGTIGVTQNWATDFSPKCSVQAGAAEVRVSKNKTNSALSYLAVSDMSTAGGSFDNLMNIDISYRVN